LLALDQQSPEEFRTDLRDSRRVLEEVTGDRVIAYRAPVFSIMAQSRWALEILVRRDSRSIPASSLSITTDTACPELLASPTKSKRPPVPFGSSPLRSSNARAANSPSAAATCGSRLGKGE
jgi:hypothetical protein